MAEHVYDDTSGLPLRAQRYEFVNDDPQSDWVYSAEIYGAFGGLWKTIEETPSGYQGGTGYVGAISFSDPAARIVRTTLPLDCQNDPTCAAYT